MRIYLKTTGSNTLVPFNYAANIVGAMHKWLGHNQYHGNMAMYSFSMLQKSEGSKAGLKFPNGSGFFISAWDGDFIQKLVKGIFESPDIAFGLKVTEATLQNDPDLSQTERFQVASPVFIKRKEGERERHYLFSDAQAGKLLTETMQHKMHQAGLSDDTLEINFDAGYPRPKTKLIAYGDIKNRANICPVIIKGNPQTKAFAWNVGVGNSTGIGFGAIC